MTSTYSGRSSQFMYNIPSTTPAKSPEPAYRMHLQKLQEQEQGHSIFYDTASQDYDAQTSTIPSTFKVPTFLERRAKAAASNSEHLASSVHRQHANEMSDSLTKLLDSNDQVSRQAQSSLSAANKSLEALRQSQRLSQGSTLVDIATRNTAPFRTTETEYDLSPSIRARQLSPSPTNTFTAPRYESGFQQNKAATEVRTTLDWLQKTEVPEIEHEDDVADQHNEYNPVPSIADELRAAERDARQLQSNYYENQGGIDYSDVREEPTRTRRSLSRSINQYTQKENIPSELNTSHNYSSISPRYSGNILMQRTPDNNRKVEAAENSLLEVAESTATITNHLRGVYNNLQEFFSPEVEAKLNNTISAIGSQKINRISKGLSSSTTKPHPPNFRSASIRKGFKKSSLARPPTAPIPFNFSERLSQLQKRHSSREPRTPVNKTARPDRRLPIAHPGPLRRQPQEEPREVDSATDELPMPLRETTPMIQNRVVNEYQEMSKSPFIPLAHRKKQLETGNLVAAPKPPRIIAGADPLPKRQLTMPKSPVLHTRTRVKSTPTPRDDPSMQTGASQSGYKAHKVDKRVFESSGDLGVPKISKPALTVPKSPVFTKRKLAPLRPAVMPSKIHPQQNYRNFQPSITQSGLVSSAESARRLSSEKMKRSTRQDSVDRHSRATLSQSARLNRAAVPTIPEPFNLATESRGAHYQEQFHNKLEKWKQIEKENKFKALPLPVYPELFVPKKSTKPLTHSLPFHLVTDERAGHWEEIERERQRKHILMQEILAEKAREEEREMRELRQRLVPHPTPIRDYPRIEIHKSSQPLTVPRSPNIGEKRKHQLTLEREFSHAHEEHHRDHDQEDSGLYSVHVSSEDPEYERERQRERERAQGQEYELRRLSSLSNSRGSDSRQQQDMIRQEIEAQRQIDAHERQASGSRQQQPQQQRYSQSYEKTEVQYRDESEMEQNKRRRLIESEDTLLHTQPQLVFGRRMGRKSWLEANDL
ncbi:hypothetical protein BGZ76_002289 [Entomortierella beljakovae]|nr:hypothetical protein BGZ76_002289 [Entomortierella beljakovae]